jgi:hypothetical protein
MGKKVIFAATAVIVVAAAVAVTFFLNRLDGAVGDYIERYGRAATGTDVSVGGVDIALTAGTGTLSRLTIDNPDGFDTDYALRIDDSRLTLDLGSVASDVPIVTEVLLDGAHLNAEQRGDATNLTEIQRYMNGSSGEPPPDADTEEGRIIIDRFRLTNARVTLTSDYLGEPEELPLRDVVVDGIGRSAGGATYAEATEAILDPILAAARSAVQERLRNAAADAAREEIREEADEAKQEAGERLKELLERE